MVGRGSRLPHCPSDAHPIRWRSEGEARFEHGLTRSRREGCVQSGVRTLGPLLHRTADLPRRDGCCDGRCPIQTTMYNSSTDHLESVKPIPQYYTVNDPLPSELEFPGCKPVHLPRGEIETYDGRLEFWDARTETAWVCEPTSPPTTSNRHKPSRLWCMGLPGCGAHRSSATEPWTCWSVMHAAGGGGSCRRILETGSYRVSGESRAFPGWTAQDIVSATGRHARPGIRADSMET